MASPVADLHVFESWSEFVKAGRGTSDLPRLSRQSIQNHPSESWDLRTGIDGARDLAEQGWPEGRRLVGQAGENIYRSLVGRDGVKMRLVYDVEGGQVDVGRFLQSDPECMTAPRRRRVGNGLVVSVHVSAAASCGIDAECMARRGAAIVAVVDGLENAGRRAEVWLDIPVRSFDGKGSLHVTSICLKAAGESVAVDVLAFALAHPATMRRLWFAYVETLPNSERVRYGFNGGGYGTPDHSWIPEAALWFGTIHYNEFQSDAWAVEWARVQVEKALESQAAA